MKDCEIQVDGPDEARCGTPESYYSDRPYRSGEVIRGLKFPRNVMPNIVRPSLQDAGTRHDVKAVTSDMLRRVSIITYKRSNGGRTASGRSIPGRSMGRK
jgi:hypothetical protein